MREWDRSTDPSMNWSLSTGSERHPISIWSSSADTVATAPMSGIINSLRGSRREDLSLHPTVKPTGLVADAIQDVTRRGDLVLDLFLGSGTTLLAAERTGRGFRGLDIDPAYVDVAIERWSARTGLEPSLEGSAS